MKFRDESSSDTSSTASDLIEDGTLLMEEADLNVGVTRYEDGHSLIRIRVSDQDTTDHKEALVVCVLDVSYSMDEAALMHADNEGTTGLSLLDVVKHATRTVIEGLSKSDLLAVVAFASTAEVVLSPTHMTANNKKLACDRVNSLTTCGSTNLWDGLAKAMDIVKEQKTEHLIDSIVLLTDGIPNIRPPRGEMHSLCRYFDRHMELKSTTISTFGFGSHLETQLLEDIAIMGGGHFCFIPDSSFVGTVFVNTIANLLATAVPKSTLCISTSSSSRADIENLSGLPSTPASWGLSIEIPPLIHGQTLVVLIKTDKSTHFEVNFGGLDVVDNGEDKQEVDETLALSLLRSKTIAVLCCRNISSQENQRNQIRAILAELPHEPNDPSLKAFIEDIEGQVVEALSREDYFLKWGRHYLPSLARAHALQQCSNFKDPGLQVYTTKMFSLLQDVLEDIFTRLPPPIPSRRMQYGSQFRALSSMEVYYDSSAPCFAKGPVKMEDGSTKDVSLLRRGDRVLLISSEAAGTSAATVSCVVETACCGGMEHLVELEEENEDSGEVLVTPWHPVRKTGDTTSSWVFPATLSEPKRRPCKSVFSFLLEEEQQQQQDCGSPSSFSSTSSFLQIGSYDGIALAHGILDDPVAKHDFLGTKKVKECLKLMSGWEEGHIKLKENPCIRDPASNLIVGFESTERLRVLHK